jgi:PAS domain S-box-containing protein
MSGLSIPPLLMGAITFYVGFYHLNLYFQLKNHREHLFFSLSCFAMGFYDIFTAGLYNAFDVTAGATWFHYQAIAGSIFALFFILFIMDYLKKGKDRILQLFVAYFSVSFLIFAIGKTSWLADITKPSIKEISLPFDLLIVYREAEPGMLINLLYSVAPFSLLYILFLIYKSHEKGEAGKTGRLAAGVLFLLCCSTNDGAVATGLYKFVYLFEYGFLVITIVMGYSLSLEIVEASRLKDMVRKSEALFRAITENTTDVTIIIDERGTFKYVSSAITNFGYEVNELIGKSILDFLDESDLSAGKNFLNNMQNLERKPIHLHDVGFVLKDRTIRCEAQITLMLQVPGVQGIVIHARDITEYLQNRQELSQAENMLSVAMDSLPHDFWILDAAGHFILQNSVARKRWGDFIGLTPQQVGEQNKQLQFLTSRTEKAQNGEMIESEVEVVIDERKYNLLTVTAPINNGDVINGVLGFNIDITSAKQSATAIVKAYEELRQLDQLKNDFLSNVSHELRSPLVTIRGYIELLLNREDTAPEIFKSWLTTAHNSVKRLGTIIDDLFDISRLQSGTLKFHFERIDLTYELHQNMKEFGPRCKTMQIELSADIAPDLPAVEADTARLRSVILNLLDNAIKFTNEQGKVRIVADSTSDNEFVLVKVIDSGIGIAEPYIEQVFDKFFQIESSSTRIHEGSGIGLSLARDIVEAHGGKIWATSKVGQGTTFQFTIPVSHNSNKKPATPSLPAQPAPEHPSPPGHEKYKPTLFLIEDDDSIRMLVKTAFGDDYDLSTAANGMEGLQLLEDSSPDLILLDLAMPDVSGFEVCKKIREDKRHQNTQIIIFSARSSEKEKFLALECGANDFIEKPISLTDLEKRLTQAMQSRETDPANN